MISLNCPHCGRSLKIPDNYAGMEGACNYCGGRLVVESGGAGGAPGEDVELLRVREEALESLRATVASLENQLEQAQEDLDRLGQKLILETAAKMDAVVTREAAERRVLELEALLNGHVASQPEPAVEPEAVPEAGSPPPAAVAEPSGAGDAERKRRLVLRAGLAALFILVALMAAAAGVYFGS